MQVRLFVATWHKSSNYPEVDQLVIACFNVLFVLHYYPRLVSWLSWLNNVRQNTLRHDKVEHESHTAICCINELLCSFVAISGCRTLLLLFDSIILQNYNMIIMKIYCKQKQEYWSTCKYRRKRLCCKHLCWNIYSVCLKFAWWNSLSHQSTIWALPWEKI